MGTTVAQFLLLVGFAFNRECLHKIHKQHVANGRYLPICRTACLLAGTYAGIILSVTAQGWYSLLPMVVGSGIGSVTVAWWRQLDYATQTTAVIPKTAAVPSQTDQSMHSCERRITITTNDGEIYIDGTGMVRGADIHPDFGPLPICFDVFEFANAYKRLDDCIDILDIGRTDHAGVHIPPNIVYRKGVARRMAREMGLDINDIGAANAEAVAMQIYAHRDTDDCLQSIFGAKARDFLSERQQRVKDGGEKNAMITDAMYLSELQICFDRLTYSCPTS